MLIHTERKTTKGFISMKTCIKKAKTKLIKKALSNGGVWENFGQKEVRELEDKFGYTKEVAEFDNWVMTFNLSTNKIGEYPPKTLIPTNKKG